MNKVVKRFSSWHGLKKFIIWILCFRDTLQSTVVQNGVVTQPSPRKRRYSKLPLTSYEMEKKRLQDTLKKKVSEEEFSIINILGGTNSKRQVKKSSNISKLNPEMLNCLLCVVVGTLPATGKPSYNFAKVLPHCSPYHSLASSCLWSLRNGTWPLPDWREALDGQRQNCSAKISKSSTLQRPIDTIVLLEGTAQVTLY